MDDPALQGYIPVVRQVVQTNCDSDVIGRENTGWLKSAAMRDVLLITGEYFTTKHASAIADVSVCRRYNFPTSPK